VFKDKFFKEKYNIWRYDMEKDFAAAGQIFVDTLIHLLTSPIEFVVLWIVQVIKWPFESLFAIFAPSAAPAEE